MRNTQNIDDAMPTVPILQLRKLVEKTKTLNDNEDVTFQLVMTALFPTVWSNIEKYSNDCYTKGYLCGLQEGLKNK